MRKRKTIVLVGVIISGVLGWMGYTSFSMLRERDLQEEKANRLSTLFESLGIQAPVSVGRTMLVYFNSECEHCQWEVNQLSENINEFQDVNLALVSLEPSDSAYQFLEKHSLQQYFIETHPENIMKTFSGGVPQVFIYEGDELKEKFRGEVKIEKLLEAIRK